MSDSGHPSRHGFVQCNWCRRWRRQSEVEPLAFGQLSPWLCRDAAWCEDEAATQRLGGGIPRGPALNTGIDANGDAT